MSRARPGGGGRGEVCLCDTPGLLPRTTRSPIECVGSSAGYAPTANTRPSAVVDGSQSMVDICACQAHAKRSPGRVSSPCESPRSRALGGASKHETMRDRTRTMGQAGEGAERTASDKGEHTEPPTCSRKPLSSHALCSRKRARTGVRTREDHSTLVALSPEVAKDPRVGLRLIGNDNRTTAATSSAHRVLGF